MCKPLPNLGGCFPGPFTCSKCLKNRQFVAPIQHGSLPHTSPPEWKLSATPKQIQGLTGATPVTLRRFPGVVPMWAGPHGNHTGISPVRHRSRSAVEPGFQDIAPLPGSSPLPSSAHPSGSGTILSGVIFQRDRQSTDDSGKPLDGLGPAPEGRFFVVVGRPVGENGRASPRKDARSCRPY